MPTTTLNTAELTGRALDWAVATASGLTVRKRSDAIREAYAPYHLSEEQLIELIGEDDSWVIWSEHGGTVIGRLLPAYSTNPTQMWLIIDREGISVVQNYDTKEWLAGIYGRWGIMHHPSPTSLIAAARCWVAHKLGPVVLVPSELVEG